MKLLVLGAAAVALGVLFYWWKAGDEARRIAQKHRMLAVKSSPVIGVAWGVAALLGWATRSRLRNSGGHASPAAAWIGKRIAVTAGAAMSIYALAPVGWPVMALYIASAAGAVGWAVYLANLPLKL